MIKAQTPTENSKEIYSFSVFPLNCVVSSFFVCLFMCHVLTSNYCYFTAAGCAAFAYDQYIPMEKEAIKIPEQICMILV